MTTTPTLFVPPENVSLLNLEEAQNPAGNKKCVICNHNLTRFLPWRGGTAGLPVVMQVLEVIGSDVDNSHCPWCQSNDRERHLFLFMQAAKLFSFITGKKVLHFAPEMHLSQIIKEYSPKQHTFCDLKPWGPEIEKVDLMGLPYQNESFDLVIANHVLEHVQDVQIAISEIRRILSPGGYAILQTPYSKVLQKTWEDPGITSDRCRYEIFGQEDHVRLFGLDIFSKITALGFISKVQTHLELLPDYCPKTFGLNEPEPFFLFQKPM